MPAPLAMALLLAQASPPAAEPSSVQLHGWLDAFYALNWNRPADGASFLPGTGTTARRANELNLNAAAVDVSLDPRPVGFHLTLGFGSGLEVVHSAEPA
ncbi:MAG TPA: outer membrane beta-barrel protein, partial [Myxococcales bacterium]